MMCRFEDYYLPKSITRQKGIVKFSNRQIFKLTT